VRAPTSFIHHHCPLPTYTVISSSSAHTRSFCAIFLIVIHLPYGKIAQNENESCMITYPSHAYRYTFIFFSCEIYILFYLYL